MVRQRLDLFGKNLVHGTVELHGSAVMEVEIPPTDAMRLDLWFVPDVAKRRSAPVFTGALRAITSEPTVIEIWSDTVDKREFHDSFYKRHAWLRVLEMREKRALPIPWLWHICAGKPQSVADGFDFRQIDGLSGCYTTATRDWHVSIVVVGELPKTRDTVLLRLLGHPPVRRQALREIDAMPDDAWEKDLATGWVRRVQFDLHDPQSLPNGELKEFVMDLLTWAREERKKDREEFREEFRKELEPQIKRELEPQIKRELEPQIKRELVENIVAQRLGRSLTADEQKTLADRVGELGAERVIALGFDHSPADFAAWLDSQEK